MDDALKGESLEEMLQYLRAHPRDRDGRSRVDELCNVLRHLRIAQGATEESILAELRQIREEEAGDLELYQGFGRLADHPDEASVEYAIDAAAEVVLREE